MLNVKSKGWGIYVILPIPLLYKCIFSILCNVSFTPPLHPIQTLYHSHIPLQKITVYWCHYANWYHRLLVYWGIIYLLYYNQCGSYLSVSWLPFFDAGLLRSFQVYLDSRALLLLGKIEQVSRTFEILFSSIFDEFMNPPLECLLCSTRKHLNQGYGKFKFQMNFASFLW